MKANEGRCAEGEKGKRRDKNTKIKGPKHRNSNRRIKQGKNIKSVTCKLC